MGMNPDDVDRFRYSDPSAGIRKLYAEAPDCCAIALFRSVALLKPVQAAEVAVEKHADHDDHRDDDEIAVARVKLRHVVEIHAVDSGDRGRHRQDRRPGRQLPRDRSLPLLLEQGREFEHAGQHFAPAVDPRLGPLWTWSWTSRK